MAFEGMKRHGTATAVLFLALVLVALRLPALFHPVLDVDEAIYGLFARVWFDGGIPYLDAVETKPLGIYALFGSLFALFGRFNLIAVHAVTIGIVGLTALVLYKTAAMLSTRRAGFFAALLYAVFSTTYIPKIIATTIEPVMLLPVALQYWLWLCFEREGKRWLAFASGAAFATACCFKYQAGMNLIVMLAYLGVVRPMLLGWRPCLRNWRGFLPFLVGAAIPPAIMLAYLWHTGALEAFFFWSLRGNADYLRGGIAGISLGHQLLTRVLPYVASTALLWILAAIACVRLGRQVARPEGRTPDAARWMLILLWFLFSIVPVCAGYRFYGHYFLLLLPPMAILAAPVMDAALAAGGKRWVRALVIFWIALPALGFLAARLYIPQLHRATGEDNLSDYKPAAAYVAAHTQPADRIVVWGFAPMIYWNAERLPATRFFWSDLMTGRVPGLAGQDAASSRERIMPEAWEMFFSDLTRRRPLYFIDTSPANLHDYGAYPVAAYPRLAEYLKAHYREEVIVNGVAFYRRFD